MKNLIRFSLLCFIFLFISCSQESTVDEKEVATKEIIIGKWNFKRIVYENGEVAWDYCTPPVSFTFYNNGDVIKGHCGGGSTEGEYLITGNLLELQHRGDYQGSTERMKANIKSIYSEEMIIEVEDGFLRGAFTGYLEKTN